MIFFEVRRLFRDLKCESGLKSQNAAVSIKTTGIIGLISEVLSDHFAANCLFRTDSSVIKSTQTVRKNRLAFKKGPGYLLTRAFGNLLFQTILHAPAKSLNRQLKTVIVGRKRHCFWHFLTFDAGVNLSRAMPSHPHPWQ